MPATASCGTTTRYARFTASMTRLVIAILTDTPTATIVETPRLRNVASRSVPPIGPMPCDRRNTTSVGAGPSSGSSDAPGLPGAMSTPLPMANIFAFWLPPSPSGRLGEDCQPGVGTDNGALAFLRDDRGVRGRRDFGEVDGHTEAGT